MTNARQLIAALTAVIAVPTATVAVELPQNDYPTSARADYVFACMQTNGQTRDALERCSCSVDAVAAIIPYAEYESTQTIMAVGQRPGDNAEIFRSYGPFKEQVKKLKTAQVEAELRCF